MWNWLKNANALWLRQDKLDKIGGTGTGGGGGINRDNRDNRDSRDRNIELGSQSFVSLDIAIKHLALKEKESIRQTFVALFRMILGLLFTDTLPDDECENDNNSNQFKSVTFIWLHW